MSNKTEGLETAPSKKVRVKILLPSTIDVGGGRRFHYAEGDTPLLNEQVAQALIKLGQAVEFHAPSVKILNKTYWTKDEIK